MSNFLKYITESNLSLKSNRSIDDLARELLSCLSLFRSNIDLGHFELNHEQIDVLFANDSFLCKAREVHQWCIDNSIHIVYPCHRFYPNEFRRLAQPPLFLSVLGNIERLVQPSLSVVGSREPSSAALDWMELHLGQFLDLCPEVITVSGGARGVDQRTHSLSVRKNRPTIAFLPSGMQFPYPRDLVNWQEKILMTGGCFVSEFSPFLEVRKHHFEKRNRLIASLSRLLFVVEARRRSGTTLTARLARDLGTSVCVLPHFPSYAESAGSVDLLFDGAFPIRDANDLSILFSLCRMDS